MGSEGVVLVGEGLCLGVFVLEFGFELEVLDAALDEGHYSVEEAVVGVAQGLAHFEGEVEVFLVLFAEKVVF